jgi:hypothetical protein
VIGRVPIEEVLVHLRVVRLRILRPAHHKFVGRSK